MGGYYFSEIDDFVFTVSLTLTGDFNDRSPPASCFTKSTADDFRSRSAPASY